ncbi:MAG: ribonuclease HI [Deltaproteobacteria bacterium]|nr:ribonuclease HI [Deltaproteobacteria bacterium]
MKTATTTTTPAAAAPLVKIFCDGSCLGNPGPGGWAALLVTETKTGPAEKLITGSTKDTTNNRMELQAAAEGLKILTKPCVVEVITDSNYVVQGMKAWIHNWKKSGWKNSQNKPVENKDLWMSLDAAAAGHTVSWKWVKGHAGHTENERVDVAAREAATLAQRA